MSDNLSFVVADLSKKLCKAVCFEVETKKSRHLSLPLGEIRRVTGFPDELCGVEAKAD